MKKTLTAGAALLLSTAAVQAGGLDRGNNNYGVLFEPGNYVEFGFTVTKPDVSGEYPAPLAALGGSAGTGDMADDYGNLSFAYKHQVNEQIAVALFLNQPYGANATYTEGFYTGLTAEWESQGISAVLKYDINENFSVYGGIRHTRSEAQITIPDSLIRGGFSTSGTAEGAAIAAGAPAGSLAYSASTDRADQTNYILGAAYQRPEIALRVALTYESGGDYDFTSDENIPAFGVLPGTAPLNALGDQEFSISMPETWRLDFQSGVAEDTLVFGQVKHQNWSVWEVRPDGYNAITGDAITSLDNDVTSWTLGVGRRINDNLSVFGRIGYEKENGGIGSRLAPTDGSRSIGVGGTYTMDGVKVTGGIQYVSLGDTTDGSGVVFEGNDAIGFGVTVGYSF